MTVLDGFWLPRSVRQVLLTNETPYTSATFQQGRPCTPDTPGSVTVRWPQLDAISWQKLIDILRQNRLSAPRGAEFWERFQIASAGRRPHVC